MALIAMKKHSTVLSALRVLNFLAAMTMLILFSIRLGRIVRIRGGITTNNTAAIGAVEGILAAATVYTFIAMVAQVVLSRRGSSKLIGIGFAAWDVIFICAYIAVAVLTSPENYSSAAACLGSNQVNEALNTTQYCSLPWGPFILSILGTVTHAITAFLSHKTSGKVVVKEEHAATDNGTVVA